MRLPLTSIAANEIALQYKEGDIFVIDVVCSCLLEHCSLRSEASYLPLALFTYSLRYLLLSSSTTALDAVDVISQSFYCLQIAHEKGKAS